MSCDVGSIPFVGDVELLGLGAKLYGSPLSSVDGLGGGSSGAARYFETQIVRGIMSKANAGVSVPAYPQYRDMNESFLERIEGIKKNQHGWVVTGPLSVQPEKLRIPEVQAILRNSGSMRAVMGHPLELRVCVTGPYTLASLFHGGDTHLLMSFGEIMSRFVAENTWSSKNAKVSIISIDEPVLGFLNDSSLDYGSQGRDALRNAWEIICRQARIHGAEALMHLHNTSIDVFWDVDNLTHIESHVDDSLYQSKMMREQCEKTDKFVRASVATTDFDSLITQQVDSGSGSTESAVGEKVAKTWIAIRKGLVNPVNYLDTEHVMMKRLERIVSLFGSERVRLAGPECGMKSFPTSECAIECLRRISRVAASFGNE
ncbi:MAG: hypothetical protein V1857_02020 [archaeon]